MEVLKELEKITNAINTSEVIIDETDCFIAIYRLYGFQYDFFMPLINKVNQLRKRANSYQEKASYLPYYEKIYKAQLQTYKKLLKAIRERSLRIIFSGKKFSDEEIKSIVERLLEKVIDDSGLDTLYMLLDNAVSERINETIDELRVIRKFPHDYINTNSLYIGPDTILRYRNDRVFYKDCSIIPTDGHSFSLSYNENSLESTKNCLIDILAYLNGCPYFLFTENPDFNRKLTDLYYNFDLLDMIRLRKKNYFKDKDYEKPIALQMPILNAVDKRSIISIPASPHETVFSLYHASLKQFEPLPRCVFLYRVFEYGANYHYQPLINPTDYDPKDALEYYFSKIFEHRYTPLYYLAYGKLKFNQEVSEIQVVKKSICKNFMTVLKKEAHAIVDEWSEHSYLKNKRLGEILYNTGRCAAAHGSGGRSMARYDYDVNYKHLNNVNIILELIARYIIDQLNPEIKKLVSQKHDEYIKQSIIGN